MKKTTLINRPLSNTIAGMGHLDMLVIGDASLPVPVGPESIDLAVCKGVPRFLETLEATLSELEVEVEKAYIDEESKTKSPDVRTALVALLEKHGIQFESIAHRELQQMVPNAKAVVRTGEYTPYCNIVLISGVVF